MEIKQQSHKNKYFGIFFAVEEVFLMQQQKCGQNNLYSCGNKSKVGVQNVNKWQQKKCNGNSPTYR